MQPWRRLAPIVLGLALAFPGTAVAEGDGGTGPEERPALEAPAGPEAPAVEAERSSRSARLRRPTGATLLRQAWRPGRTPSLEDRVRRVRVTALELGIRSLDDAARAVLLDESLGEPLERAEAAALLAPELPAAHSARARALFSSGRPGEALGALADAWGALGRHLEASLWLRATLFGAAARIALWTGLLFLVLAGAWALPRTVRGLAHVGSLPLASAAAWVAVVLIAPGALGEGALGVACVAAFLAACGTGAAQRATVMGAVGLVLLALFPLAERLDAELRALPTSPVLEAVYTTERGLPTPIATARLEYAAGEHPLAQRALATAARRNGDPGSADLRFRRLLAADEDPAPELLANAANVRLAVDDLDGAIDLYEQAVLRAPSPLTLFNLSQAYGRAIRLDDQDQALSDAQRLDAEAVRELTDLVKASETLAAIDLALPPRSVRATYDGRAAMPALRGRFAPGWLGGDLARCAAFFAALVALAFLGRGQAARLWTAGEPAGPTATDPSVRMSEHLARRAAQARRERCLRVAAVAVPGLAAYHAGSPILALGTIAAAVAAGVCVIQRHGVVPDPLAAGGTGAVLLLALAAVAATLYAVLLTVGLLLRGRS